jgi:hypothetical protein
MADLDKPVWYLAYGSNLAESTFKGRRNIKPLDQKNVVVPGVELTFDLPAFPYIEPRMANCRYADEPLPAGPELDDMIQTPGKWTGKGAMIGVSYLVTAKDYQHIFATEGAGSSYQFVEVDACVIDEQGRRTGEIVRSNTLLAVVEKTPFGAESMKVHGQSSLRYLNIIRKGAREHQLPPNYIAWLDDRQHFRITTIRQHLGRASFIATWALPLIGITLLIVQILGRRGSVPKVLERARSGVFYGMRWSYLYVWKPIFGEGERMLEKEGEGSIRLPEIMETANLAIPQTIVEKTHA